MVTLEPLLRETATRTAQPQPPDTLHGTGAQSSILVAGWKVPGPIQGGIPGALWGQATAVHRSESPCVPTDRWQTLDNSPHTGTVIHVIYSPGVPTRAESKEAMRRRVSVGPRPDSVGRGQSRTPRRAVLLDDHEPAPVSTPGQAARTTPSKYAASLRWGVALVTIATLSLPLGTVAVAVPRAGTDAAGSASVLAAPDLLDATAFRLRAERLAALGLTQPGDAAIFLGYDEVPSGTAVVGSGAVDPLISGLSLTGLLIDPLAASRYVSPVPGAITSAFGPRFHPILHFVRMHNGVDMTASCGTPVVSMTDGRVTRAGGAGGYGNLVEIDHGTIDEDQVSTRYAHLSVVGVTVGQTVSKGQVIGLAGTTGLSTACHLHFVVLVDGSFVDPAAFLAGAPYARIPSSALVPVTTSVAPANEPLPLPVPFAVLRGEEAHEGLAHGEAHGRATGRRHRHVS